MNAADTYPVAARKVAGLRAQGLTDYGVAAVLRKSDGTLCTVGAMGDVWWYGPTVQPSTASAAPAVAIRFLDEALARHCRAYLPSDMVNEIAGAMRELGLAVDGEMPMPSNPLRKLAPALPDDIRAQGWAVAVHNDYRLNGEPHTFWLFTKDGRCVKGEGRTDADALKEVRALLATAQQPLETQKS